MARNVEHVVDDGDTGVIGDGTGGPTAAWPCVRGQNGRCRSRHRGEQRSGGKCAALLLLLGVGEARKRSPRVKPCLVEV